MDTDNLTPMAYETISLAGNVLDVLRTEIGAFATVKNTEDDFLRGVRSHLRAILRSARGYLDDPMAVSRLKPSSFNINNHLAVKRVYAFF
ncbi:MAG: hypothetical protein COX51_03110 [Syntrophobacteraceae bacterium CG23_combo_of_CG06-09_8_20_14_all_50_8]|nr:MAG: hypothetical protein COX51_03110 [Syntrophobacteraceae bacterium CG23_combo_of_CG06-09_8_20_14_all_50_8]